MVFLLPYIFFVQSYICVYITTHCIILYIFFYYYYCYFFLAVLGFVATHGLSLVVASRGYSLVVVCRLLFTVAPLVLDHGCRVHGLSSCST